MINRLKLTSFGKAASADLKIKFYCSQAQSSGYNCACSFWKWRHRPGLCENIANAYVKSMSNAKFSKLRSLNSKDYLLSFCLRQDNPDIAVRSVCDLVWPGLGCCKEMKSDANGRSMHGLNTSRTSKALKKKISSCAVTKVSCLP